MAKRSAGRRDAAGSAARSFTVSSAPPQCRRKFFPQRPLRLATVFTALHCRVAVLAFTHEPVEAPLDGAAGFLARAHKSEAAGSGPTSAGMAAVSAAWARAGGVAVAPSSFARLPASAVAGGASAATVAAASDDQLGGGWHSWRREQLLTVHGSCTEACSQCFADHWQGCLAFCEVGCEDTCVTRLNDTDCHGKEEWRARVGHILEAFGKRAVMCKATGVDGCPESQDRKDAPPPLPLEPYAAAQHGRYSRLFPMLAASRNEAVAAGQARAPQQHKGP